MTGKIDDEKACEMIKALFAEKLKEKEDEVELISQRIKEVQSALQLVRYGSVTNLSNQTQIYVSFAKTDQIEGILCTFGYEWYVDNDDGYAAYGW